MEHITKDSFSYVGEDASKREAITRPSVTFMQDAMRRLRQNKVALVCAVAIVIMIVASTVAPMLCPGTALFPHQCGDDDLVYGSGQRGRRPYAYFWYGHPGPRHLHQSVDGRKGIPDHCDRQCDH